MNVSRPSSLKCICLVKTKTWIFLAADLFRWVLCCDVKWLLIIQYHCWILVHSYKSLRSFIQIDFNKYCALCFEECRFIHIINCLLTYVCWWQCFSLYIVINKRRHTQEKNLVLYSCIFSFLTQLHRRMNQQKPWRVSSTFEKIQLDLSGNTWTALCRHLHSGLVI